MSLPRADSRHGSISAYANHACRCALCTEAHRVYGAKLRASRQPLGEDDSRHGTTNAYTNYGCRCELCNEAMSLFYRARRTGA